MNTLAVGIQSREIISDDYPLEGFEMIKRAGFSCCDFSLEPFLTNKSKDSLKKHVFFQQSIGKLENFFAPYKRAAQTAGIRINQMNMPYMDGILNELGKPDDNVIQMVLQKSMEICAFFDCPYIVLSAFPPVKNSGLENQWERTERFLDTLIPMAKELKITLCLNNPDTKKALSDIDCLNERYGSEILGFCFDTGYANLAHIDFENFIVMLGSRLKVLCVHDNDGIRNLHQIPFTGSISPINWKGIISGLRKTHFDNVLSLDITSVLSAFPKEMKQDVLKFAAQVGSYFVGEIEGSNL
ncbi:MAG: sugar phosphate isomerase/epimerase [Lachnospiraceae bacterium]|nr:sugar phosphate isomerase/epimerase [Lachnospiraceae bacterium]